jgi:LmbE family N-acetylglucosaminyl deacetylase
MAYTLVCFHAHPDDEALLTAGTMAKAAAAGHRVVLVVATRGEVGQVATDFLGQEEDLGRRRWTELERSAEILGVARLEWLGYLDSGSRPTTGRFDAPDPPARTDGTDRTDRTDDETTPRRFADVDPDQAAARLAEILRDERADVLTSYDPNGGYGHPDHVQVHRVGARAGALAATPVVLEATIERELMRTGVDLARGLGYQVPTDFSPESFDRWYTPADTITHAVDVSAQLPQKRAAMAAHASQATSEDPAAERTLELFLGLPEDYFALAFATEWFVQAGRPTTIRADDIFASLDPHDPHDPPGQADPPDQAGS